MSAAGLVGALAGCLAAVAAVVSLLAGARRQAGPARRAYLWFAVAAVLQCASLIVSQTVPFTAGSATMVLSFADLPAFGVLPVMAVGLGLLASAAPAQAAEPLPARRSRRGLATLGAYLVDGYLLSSALFLFGWVALFGPAFTSYAEGAGTFGAELVHPLADLVFLAGTLAAAGAAGRRGTMPYLALAAVTVGDALAVGARITGNPPGVAALVVQVLALLLLALAPWGWSIRPAGFQRADGALWVTTATAAAAAAMAAVLVTVQAMIVGRLPQPVVLIVLGVTVVALGARVVGLVRRVNSWARVWQESGRRFRQLADRTSDVVLICDLAGFIRYASRAVADYGYTPDSLAGRQLTDLLHPQDRVGGIRVVHRAIAGEPARTGRYPCRVRAADGTWRHVESTVSRYRDPGGPDQLLVTARDISAQIELRRQVTHLTFHDALTGLPNRAYIERRTQHVIGQSAALAIVLGVDGFGALNDAGGRGAGDLLLVQVARRLRLAVSPQDTVARWGGDEFAVLIEGGSLAAAGPSDVPDVAERLAHSVPAEPFQLGDADVTLTVSVGVAFADGSPAAQIWRNAEMAMALARDAGGNRVELSPSPPPPGAHPPGNGTPGNGAPGIPTPEHGAVANGTHENLAAGDQPAGGNPPAATEAAAGSPTPA
jgi:diguanylate cyclase (GGDEF)-like protein/PAS domain S-box-containing protein